MSVKLGGTLTQVASFDHRRLLVTLVHGPDQVGVQVLNLLLNGRLTLNPIIFINVYIFTNKYVKSYLLEFILAENGREDMLSSIGRLTDGMGMLEMPLS